MPPKWRHTKVPLLLLFPCMLCAQHAGDGGKAADALPVYDVAAIRLNTSDSNNMRWDFRGNSFTTENTTLEMLLEWTFAVRQHQVFGLPPWAQKAHYDISAKAVEATQEQMAKLTDKQREDMSRLLWEQRFHLRWHYETRDMATYQLVQAKDGAKLQTAKSGDPQNGNMSMNDTQVQGTGIPLANLAESITGIIGRPVVDKTGLAGLYTLELHWAPDASAGADNGSKESGQGNASIFTALQEQLGLKLQSGHDPIRVVVVDHIEPPTEN